MSFEFSSAMRDHFSSIIYLNRVPYLALAKTFEEIERVSARFVLYTIIILFCQSLCIGSSSCKLKDFGNVSGAFEITFCV
jgi:hypothetical protein